MREFRKGRLYIYKVVKVDSNPFNTKLELFQAIEMIGILGPMPENECGLFSNTHAAEGDFEYEVWLPDYLEKHPDSTSDMMLSAGITHKSVQLRGAIR